MLASLAAGSQVESNTHKKLNANSYQQWYLNNWIRQNSQTSQNWAFILWYSHLKTSESYQKNFKTSEQIRETLLASFSIDLQLHETSNISATKSVSS